MSVQIDITGQRFGRLIAVCPTPDRNIRGLVIWTCLCVCGNKCKVNGNHLRTGHTNSCGCISKERLIMLGKSKIPHFEGKRFGRLMVIKQMPVRRVFGKSRQVMWECQCDCGGTILVSTSHLKAGYYRSCGCLQQANRFVKGTNINPMDVPFEVTNTMNARRELKKAIKQAS